MVDITAAEVFRDFATDGVPSSGPHNPRKPDIRKLLKQYETIITAFMSSGGVIYANRAAIDADLARPANTMAWVLGDAVAANNGIYRKAGASGAGNWVHAGDLPYSFILASNVGAGTPSAIQATTTIPVSGSALILLQIAEDYVGEAANVSFNGAAPLTIKTNSGENVRNLASGSVVYGVISDGTFRLSNDEAIASLIYEARDQSVAAKEAAEAARDIAAGYASDAVSQGNVPIYATIVGMPALEVPAGINAIRVNGNYAAGDGSGGLFVDTNNGSAETFTTADGRTWYRAADVGLARMRPNSVDASVLVEESATYDKISKSIRANSDVVITVGLSGDVSTINAALERASKLRLRAYVFGGFTVEIRLLAGFQMAEQVYVRDIDLSYIVITSEATEVTIIRSALTYQVGGGTDADFPAFSGVGNARMPRIDVLFNMDTSGLAAGRTFLYLEDHSTGYVGAGKGCKNASGRGIEARHNCAALANSVVLTGCLDRAIYALHGSNVYAELADVSGCQGDVAVYALMDTTVMFVQGNAQGKANSGPAIWANRGGWIVATQANASGASIQSAAEGVVYATDGGRITFDDALVNNSGGNGVAAGYGGHVSCRQVQASNAAQNGLYAFNGGTISANDAVVSGCVVHGIFAQDGASIDATRVNASGCGTGARASHGSRINFRSANATGYVTRGAHAERGGYINVNLSNCQKAGSNVSSDIVVLSNGKIDALGATGGLSQTANTITSAGIINQ